MFHPDGETNEPRIEALLLTHSERVNLAMLLLNKLYGKLDAQSFQEAYLDYYNLMEHMKALRDDLKRVES